MLRQDEKIKSNTMAQQLYVLITLALALTVFTGCSVIEIPAPRQWECTPAQSSELENWHCRGIGTNQCLAFERVADEECDYIEPSN